MKLRNITTSWFVVALVIIISVWAAIFYYAMLDEIYDSIDDGLDNQKQLIIKKIIADSSLLRANEMHEMGFALQEIPAPAGLLHYDRYIDTTLYMQNEDDHEPVRMLTTAFRHGNKYYQLQVATSMVEEDDLVKELLISLLWLFAGLIISIILLNKLLHKRIWKPFYHLLTQLRTYKLDKQEDIDVVPTRIEEFDLLNKNVRALLQRNKETYNHQKQFIENASHELQTPLAISINKLEALAEQGNLSENELLLLGTALNNLERMARLNRSLLLLSRIENRQYAEAEKINVNDLVQKLVADFTEQASYSATRMEVVAKENGYITMHPDLGMIMLTNLVKNAIVHNQPGGIVHIVIDQHKLEIANTGNPVPLDVNIIFNRFYKANPAASSTGLGLAIVKAVADLYNIPLNYHFKGMHVFTIELEKN